MLIARALAQRSGCIVMDEPTASLDFGNQARVLEQVSTLRGHGVGVLISTHDPDHALRIADRVLVMHEGGMLAQGVPAETLDAALMGRVYGVDVTIGDVIDPASGKPVGRTCLPRYGHRQQLSMHNPGGPQ